MRRKLKSCAGETLAEVLVSILVVALAVLLLASMVSASGNIDLSTRERDAEFYEELTQTEIKKTEKDHGAVVVEWKNSSDGSAGSREFEVDVYGGEGLTSYAKGN